MKTLIKTFPLNLNITVDIYKYRYYVSYHIKMYMVLQTIKELKSIKLYLHILRINTR